VFPTITPEHPRPQLQRTGWISLDGPWEFAFDRDAAVCCPDEVDFDRVINVPFAPEAPLSGIGDQSYTCAVWYRRMFDEPRLAAGDRLLLHFGAVDYLATVWIDGGFVGSHQGGYTPFTLDITDAVRGPGPHELIVRAGDDPHDLSKPRGKQDWQLAPHAIWYPRTTGIWQTVWLERVPRNWIETLRWTSSLDQWEIGLEAMIAGPRRDELMLDVRLTVGEGPTRKTLAHDRYAAVSGEVHRRIALSDPGIDDFRNELLWSPHSPTLIDVELRLIAPDGTVVDEAASYTALRSVGVQGDRFILNGRPFYLRMALDQGYWPDGGLTAPSLDALRRDVELAKAMGLNGVRKHQKLEDPRYLYWADKLGLLVWAEMPSAYRFTRRCVERLSNEWGHAIMRDISHPCVVTWVPFNESWGVPDLPSNPAQRDYVQGLYHLTRTLDPTRPVVGNDGWESAATDMIGIHDYDDDPAHLAERYGEADGIPHLFRRVRPAGRLLALDGHEHRGQPLILSEFGGIAFTPLSERESSWGYSRAESEAMLARKFGEMMETVKGCAMLAGFCYTQFADTYQEANGILYADRTPKLPIEVIAQAFGGRRSRRAEDDNIDPSCAEQERSLARLT
jgi:beta-galactosidase/beta-glucuronidase